MKRFKSVSFFLLVLLYFGCGPETVAPEINLLSIRVGGATFTNNLQDVPIDANIEMTFSSVLDINAFPTQVSVTSNSGTETVSISYTNSNSKVVIDLDLDYEKTYTVKLNAAVIGANGEEFKEALSLTFSTAADNIIRSMAPCTNPSQCVENVLLTGTTGTGTFEFYSNYPIYEENAQWEDLKQAIIVVHGANHDPQNYFSYLTNTLNAESLSASTVLIAPFFRNNSTGNADDFYWTSSVWRDGKLSSNSNKISSFEVVDELIKQLADSEHFPVLDQIIVTGQSSGGRFTHVYAPANKSEELHTNITFDYVVSESQYFYYPDGQRIDENNNQLFTPTTCNGYDFWPFGYNLVPDYLSGTSATAFNQRFVNRSITYLLGNGNGNDVTLNTSNCSATLLGSTRYQRGENIFQYMELVYPNTHNHGKRIANGISHNGSAIYQSSTFKTLLADLLNN